MHLPNPRVTLFILGLPFIMTLPSCAVFDPVPEVIRSTPIEFSLDALTPEQRQLSVEQAMQRFGEAHEFLTEKNCFRFIAPIGPEKGAETATQAYGESCFTLEPQAGGVWAVAHARRSWQANMFLGGWYSEMDELKPEQAIIDGLQDGIEAVQKHNEYLGFLQQYEIKRRILDPYKILTKQQKELLLNTYNTVLDMSPEKFEQYAGTQHYRKRWMLGSDLPGSPKIKVFFAAPFIEQGISSLFVQDHVAVEALVRVVAYDFVPEQFSMQNTDLSLTVTKPGQWRLENRSAETVRIYRIGGRYHKMDALLFGTQTEEEIDMTAKLPISVRGLAQAFQVKPEEKKEPAEPIPLEFMDLAPHQVLEMDASQTEFARYRFPSNPFLGIRDWEQHIYYGFSIEYERAGEKRILKHLERFVPQL